MDICNSCSLLKSFHIYLSIIYSYVTSYGF